MNRHPSPAGVQAPRQQPTGCPAEGLCRLEGSFQSTSTLLLVLMAEFILFFRSLSRFMFSILKTKRNTVTPRCPISASQGGERSWQLRRQVPGRGLHSRSVCPLPVSGLPRLLYSLGPPRPHESVYRSLGHFLKDLSFCSAASSLDGSVAGWLALAIMSRIFWRQSARFRN